MASPDHPLSLFHGRRCLVTGGLGFIGSNLVHALVGAGASVVVVDALVAEHGGDLRNLDGVRDDVEVVVSDLGDGDVLGPVLDGTQAIFNLAGQVSHLSSMIDPLRDLDLNVRSHVAFLELVRRRAPRAPMVYASTRQVYGRPRYLPVDESHPTEPVDVNGIDKLACEQFHTLYAAVHGLTISALRLTNVYGPRQSLCKDGLGFLPVFVRLALAGHDISVYGDGTQLRDCLHVDDVVRALVLAVITDEVKGEVFNLGHADALELGAVARLTARAAGRGSSVATIPWPSDHQAIDIGSFHGDYSKAKRVLGWEPRIDFAEGIAATVAFYAEHPWYRSSI